MKLNKYDAQISHLTSVLTKNDVLCYLAEEASELSQATLKLRRALKAQTPKTEQECISDLMEEVADVMVSLDAVLNKLGLDDFEIEANMLRKCDRWHQRVFGGRSNEPNVHAPGREMYEGIQT